MTLDKIKSLNVPMARKLELAVDELLRVSKNTPVKTKRDVAIVEQSLLKAKLIQPLARQTKFGYKVDELVARWEKILINTPY